MKLAQVELARDAGKPELASRVGDLLTSQPGNGTPLTIKKKELGPRRETRTGPLRVVHSCQYRATTGPLPKGSLPIGADE